MATDTDGLTGNDFVDKLLERAPATAFNAVRGQNYNYPLRTYVRPDGQVVKLQGDPQNRAYYQDQGFTMLSDVPGRNGMMSEVDQYWKVEYPKILKEQREKAALINAIRRAGERYRDLALQDTFDEYTVEEIRDYLRQIKEETGKDIRVIVPKRQAVREAAEDAKLLSGLETSDNMSLEALQGKLEAGRERTFQGTGYDPIEQARKRTSRGMPT
jgi:hypothetical protein